LLRAARRQPGSRREADAAQVLPRRARGTGGTRRVPRRRPVRRLRRPAPDGDGRQPGPGLRAAGSSLIVLTGPAPSSTSTRTTPPSTANDSRLVEDSPVSTRSCGRAGSSTRNRLSTGALRRGFLPQGSSTRNFDLPSRFRWKLSDPPYTVRGTQLP